MSRGLMALDWPSVLQKRSTWLKRVGEEVEGDRGVHAERSARADQESSLPDMGGRATPRIEKRLRNRWIKFREEEVICCDPEANRDVLQSKKEMLETAKPGRPTRPI